MRKIFLPVLCGLVALALSSKAGAIPVLTLTEQSSTLLDWSWSGNGNSGSIQSSVPDSWGIFHIDLPVSNVNGADFISAAWQESPTSYNQVDVYPDAVGFTVIVVSGLGSNGPFGFANGHTEVDHSGRYAVTFIDNTAAVSTPEAGGTLILLSAALGSLILIGHRWRIV